MRAVGIRRFNQISHTEKKEEVIKRLKKLIPGGMKWNVFFNRGAKSFTERKAI